ncbi:VirC2 family conjugal transfer protein [Bradyrhizobium sp. Arg314]
MGISRPTISVKKVRQLAAMRLERSPVVSTPAFSNPSEATAPTELAGLSTSVTVAPPRALPARKTVGLSKESYQADPKVQVFLSAALPARGISASFDMLTGQYRPAKVLQMILRRALDDYELLVSDGAFTKITPVYSVAEPPVFVATSRMMPRRLVDMALAHLDPFGVESARTFGRKLATSALVIFFENEKKVFPEAGRFRLD